MLAAGTVHGDVNVVDEVLEAGGRIARDEAGIGGEDDQVELALRVLQGFPEVLVGHRLAAREDDPAHATQLVDHVQDFIFRPAPYARRFGAIDAAEVAVTG